MDEIGKLVEPIFLGMENDLTCSIGWSLIAIGMLSGLSNAFYVCQWTKFVTHGQSTIDSEGFKRGTRSAPIMPRDAVSRTANVGTVGTNGIEILCPSAIARALRELVLHFLSN